MDDLGPIPRYKWRLTWPDESKDHFIALDGERKFGMIYRHHNGEWAWFMNWDFPFQNSTVLKPKAGHADTARLAAKEAEDCYEAVLACEWPGMTDRDKQWIREGRVGGMEENIARLGKDPRD